MASRGPRASAPGPSPDGTGPVELSWFNATYDGDGLGELSWTQANDCRCWVGWTRSDRCPRFFKNPGQTEMIQITLILVNGLQRSRGTGLIRHVQARQTRRVPVRARG